MKRRTLKGLLLLVFTSATWVEAAAQSASGANPNYLVYTLLAVVALLILGMLIQVSDNLLGIKARQVGADKSGQNYSVYPRLNEIFDSPKPEFAAGAPIISLKKGFDILLEGEAARKSVSIHVKTYAVQPPNYKGISPIPKMEVEIGDEVKAGDVLFHDKTNPQVKFVAPVSGEVIAVNRAAKRAIAEVVILADKEQQYRTLTPPDSTNCSVEELQSFLMDAGGWALLRQRPFDIIPAPGDVPRDIFISTFDTAPLAPDLNYVVEGRGLAFQKGLDVLARLTNGKVWLGLDARGDKKPSAVFTEASGVEKTWFRGKHPAGNVGVQIHNTQPIRSGDKVWVLGVQEVISLGALFVEERYNAARVVALTGAELKETGYAHTVLGANIGDLLEGRVSGDNVRIISGDVLTGLSKDRAGFLGAFDDQVTVLEEGDDYEMFGWLVPAYRRPTVSRTYLSNLLFPKEPFRANTNTHGEKRAFVVTGQYEDILPMDVLPQHLCKAILAGDIERMEGLGILEISEEDIALCEFACTSKQPLQAILRDGLEMMQEQM